MKKLLLLLFSLTLSYNALADNITTGMCIGNMEKDGIEMFRKDFPLIDSNELLSICSEGDILNLGGFRFFDSPEYLNKLDSLKSTEWEEQFENLIERESSSSSSKFTLSLIMAKYCDLKETHIIGNEILVCKLVDRDFKLYEF